MKKDIPISSSIVGVVIASTARVDQFFRLQPSHGGFGHLGLLSMEKVKCSACHMASI